MPTDVIDRIHTLARRSGASVGLAFTDRAGNLIITPDEEYNSDDDETYSPSDDDSADDDSGDERDLQDNDADHIPIEGVYDDHENNVDENIAENDPDESEEDNLDEDGNVVPALIARGAADADDSDDEDDDESMNENDAKVEVEVPSNDAPTTEVQTDDHQRRAKSRNQI
eukprot:scaffold173251_cov25-Attheya_sp.AAC.1